MSLALSAKSAVVRPGQHEQGTPFPIKRIDAGPQGLTTTDFSKAAALWNRFGAPTHI